MNTRSLEYLVALEKYRHFQNAADACNITQPTMSFQIRKLENELGVQIVERTTRKFSFTKTGLEIVKQAGIVLNEYQQLKNMANDPQNLVSPNIIMGIIPTLAPFIYQHLSEIYNRNYPTHKLNIVEGTPAILQAMINKGEIDCAITCKPPDTKSFTELELFNEPVVIGVGHKHRFFKLNEIDLRELKGNSFLMPASSNCLFLLVKKISERYELRIDTQFTSMHFDSLKHIIASTNALCFFPLITALGYADQYIKFLRCQPIHERRIVLLFRSGHPMRQHYRNLQHELSECINKHLKDSTQLIR